MSAKTETKKSSLRRPSRFVSRPDNLEGGEETEIAAHISVPKDGGWGWVVLASSFLCSAFLDGICFTFGNLIGDISNDFAVSDSLAALVNSFAVAIYLLGAPIGAAFINRFGFRACAMCGSAFASLSMFISYFATNVAYLIIFYGVFAGFGFCFINLAAGLVVGYYFERLRSIAIPIATCGSSFGIMVLSALNTYLVALSGWRSTTLLHCGLIGCTYFFGMTFQPLLTFTVSIETDETTRTITFLPNVSTPNVGAAPAETDAVQANATERFLGAASNYHFPKAAAVIKDVLSPSATKANTSTAVSKIKLIAHVPQGGISHRNLHQLKSFISKTNKDDTHIEKHAVLGEEHEDVGCWGRLCRWEKHIPISRPLYRDDAFYEGKLEKLPVYHKSKLDARERKTGLEYQLAVTRAATTEDVKEHRGVFTTAARRIIATMVDINLLRRKSFLCLCFVCFIIYLGVLVPYVFIYQVNFEAGLMAKDCNLLISIIGLSNGVGRIVLGIIASKTHPLNVYSASLLLAGLSTALSRLSSDKYFQFTYCAIFGFNAAGITCLRSLVLVELYGLDNLTNATGLVLMFHGIGSLFGTPLAGILKDNYSFSVSFIVAGSLMTLAGLLVLLVHVLYKREKKY